jgi:SAM-dependent methyltransferase
MIKYYDKENKRLAVIGESATEEFWEKHWLNPKDFEMRVKAGSGFGIIKKYTSKFLIPPAKVIDAGCGIGQNVYGLSQWGYDAYGIDFTEEVIKKTKQIFSNLKIFTQDVRKLDFADNFFDGYWSLGVIEHFESGYGDIIKEARRVIKSDGYLFLTVPWFSPLRRMKAWFGLYQKLDKNTDMGNFYEFMLSDLELVKKIENEGFELISRHPHDAVKGLKDEISFLKPILQKVYNGRGIIARAVRGFITLIFAPFAGHIILLIFKKNENNL